MLNALATGFTRDAVVELSRQRGEPEWMLQKRLDAWEVYESTPAPLGRRGDLGTLKALANFKFQQLNPYVPADQGGLPAAIQQSLQEALVNERSGLIVQHNSSVVHSELVEELRAQGVILSDLATAGSHSGSGLAGCRLCWHLLPHPDHCGRAEQRALRPGIYVQRGGRSALSAQRCG